MCCAGAGSHLQVHDAASGMRLLCAPVFAGARIHDIAHCSQDEAPESHFSCLLALRGGMQLCVARLHCTQSSPDTYAAAPATAAPAALWHLQRMHTWRICRHWILSAGFAPPSRIGCDTEAAIAQPQSVELMLGFSDNSVELWQLQERNRSSDAQQRASHRGACITSCGPASATASKPVCQPQWCAERRWRAQSSERLLLYCMDVRATRKSDQAPACDSVALHTPEGKFCVDVASGALHHATWCMCSGRIDYKALHGRLGLPADILRLHVLQCSPQLCGPHDVLAGVHTGCWLLLMYVPPNRMLHELVTKLSDASMTQLANQVDICSSHE